MGSRFLICLLMNLISERGHFKIVQLGFMGLLKSKRIQIKIYFNSQSIKTTKPFFL